MNNSIQSISMKNQITFGNSKKKVATDSVRMYAQTTGRAQNLEGHLIRSTISFKEMIACVGGFFASLGAYLGFKKSEKTESQPIAPTNPRTYKDDVEQLIGIEKEMDYGNALMRGQHDERILGSYIKRFEELEEDKNTVINRMVSRVLENPKYEDLPEDYPEKIKTSVSSDFSNKDYSFNGEESVDRIIESIRQSEKLALEENTEEQPNVPELKETLIGLGYTAPEVQNMSARHIISAIDAQAAILEGQSDSIAQLIKDFEAGKIGADKVVKRLEDIIKQELDVRDKDYDVKMNKIIDLLIKIDEKAECKPNNSEDEGVKSDLNNLIGN